MGIKARIDKGVPLPPKGRPGATYPWPQMKVGDSVFFAGHTQKASSPVSAAKQYGRRNGVSFAARERVEHGVAGLRIWRTA